MFIVLLTIFGFFKKSKKKCLSSYWLKKWPNLAKKIRLFKNAFPCGMSLTGSKKIAI